MMTKIAITGYIGCNRVSKTFYGVDANDCYAQIEAWAAENNVCDWSQDVRR